ncbi:two-component system histidine kinase PnpS [Syntrophobotulus glycolicus]|uniref:two-component system histidine kinase PnpS n=1 Tax=Syntrophobotulus glycolicus TaxID=51197 RepID=UPI00145EF3FD|nr:sensor histidine kinase [Syntrophobotulus glycolicus]
MKYAQIEIEEKLRSLASMMASDLGDEAAQGMKLDYDRAAKKYADLFAKSEGDDSFSFFYAPPDSSIRVTFIDFKGQVLGESETDYQTMENHLSRKEIQEAIKGNIGQDIRASHTLDVDFLYIAAPISSTEGIARVSVPLNRIKHINQMIWLYALVGILGGLLFTIPLAKKLSSSVTKPVRELINACGEIAKGNYFRRVYYHANDELGEMAKNFNLMASKLENTVKDLTEQNAKVDSILKSMQGGLIAVNIRQRIILINTMACDILGIPYHQGILGMNLIKLVRNQQINKVLRDSMEKNVPQMELINIEEKIIRVYANPIKGHQNENMGGIVTMLDITNIKKLEQMRTEFVSNVSHELKTPLTSIRGFIDTLKDGAVNDPEVAGKFLDIIDIEAERLSRLINEILQLSEIESMKQDRNIEDVFLKPVIDEVFSILQQSAEERKVGLHADIAESVSIQANKDKIKQLLINLIDNAIKYNIENGSVTVKAEQAGGKVLISVRDTGIGIEKEYLDRIFERFYRVDRGRSSELGGTGLGLSIVKHIVNLYQGRIDVDSDPGKGTEFKIEIPD